LSPNGEGELSQDRFTEIKEIKEKKTKISAISVLEISFINPPNHSLPSLSGLIDVRVINLVYYSQVVVNVCSSELM